MSINDDFVDMCKKSGCTVDIIRGLRRSESVAWQRSVIIYKLREEGHKWDDIADVVHKDRSTCISAFRKVKLVSECLEKLNV